MQNNINENTSNTFWNNFESFAGNKLHEPVDIKLIIESAYKQNNPDALEDIAFTGKYIFGLFKVLIKSQQNPDVQDISNIQNDLSKNLPKLIEQLENLFDENPPAEALKEKYCTMKQESLQALEKLLPDLDLLKIFLNERKRIS